MTCLLLSRCILYFLVGLVFVKNNLQHGALDPFPIPDPRRRREEMVEEPVCVLISREQKHKTHRAHLSSFYCE
jgi:hypothetical protein